MKMIVGLGNPGKSYEKNRHNIGFHCVDALAEKHGMRFDVKKGNAKVALGTVQMATVAVPDAEALGQPATTGAAQGDSRSLATMQLHRVVLAKPQTFMNLSGRSVAALARFYKIALPDMLVIFDDLDLPLGVVRLRASGGSGGHNGMKSIIAELGSNEFPRLRMGIGRPPGRMDPAAYVLQDFSAQQVEVMAQARDLAVAACEHWLAYGIESAMNAFNARSAAGELLPNVA